jgi:hypothetical protein
MDTKARNMAPRASPASFRVQKYLGGLRYPAAKPQIVECARAKGADEVTMHALVRLPEREYESPISLSREVAAAASG